MKPENQDFLTSQIITYLGNKRALAPLISEAVEGVLRTENKDKLAICDLFSGSGVCARHLKRFSRELYVNDLEQYCAVINRCYLANQTELDLPLLKRQHAFLLGELEKGLHDGFVSRLYAPQDSSDVKQGERAFFTTRNARYIDTCRALIEGLPEEQRSFFVAPLLYEASVKNNTGGVFKGFYKDRQGLGCFGGQDKNALSRILADIRLPFPVFSNFDSRVVVAQQDANQLVKDLPPLDLIYIDPPYNQHPYGSNYFILNLICDYREPRELSPVSGIPKGWNRSAYNKKARHKSAFFDLCARAQAKYLLISFSSDAFLPLDELKTGLSEIGHVTVTELKYNVYRASRNLSSRDIHLNEYLFLVKK